MISDEFRNLRAGAVTSAAGVKDSTMRAWIRNNGLILGDREKRESGNPRYDLVDAARLTLMRFLFERLMMPAGGAVALVNAASDHFIVLADAELKALDTPGSSSEGRRYVMLVDRIEEANKPWIGLHDDPWASSDRAPILEIRIELREVVRMARDRLASIVGISFASLRHDFADNLDR